MFRLSPALKRKAPSDAFANCRDFGGHLPGPFDARFYRSGYKLPKRHIVIICLHIDRHGGHAGVPKQRKGGHIGVQG